jgi:hypothetical protein
MKAISGKDFGDRETLKQTYQSYMKPVFTFNASVWYPRIEPNAGSIEQLQSTQNSATRLITGNHKMASKEHLLAEMQLLSVREQLELSCKQFLESASCPSHPSHATVRLLMGSCLGRKKIHHTLQSRFGQDIEPYLQDCVLPEAAVKRMLSAIHTCV